MTKSDFEVIGKGNIIVRCIDSSNQVINSNKEIIEKIWSEECKNKNYRLFNGEVLFLIDIRYENADIIVDTKFTEYKNVLASRKKPELELNIKQVGVSGIIVVEDDKKRFILFSTRSNDITEYPGHIELVPSGNIDKSVFRSNGTIDYISKLKEEFHEETGLSFDHIKEVKSICFVYDKKNQVFDIGCLIILHLNRTKLIKSFTKVNEYENPEFVPIESLNDFMKRNEKKIVPTSLALLKCFLEFN